MTRKILMAVGLVVAVAAAPAQADLKAPFATGKTHCYWYGPNGDADEYHAGSLVIGDHPQTLMKVQSTSLGGGNADFKVNRWPLPDYGAWEVFWWENNISFWREGAPVVQGEQVGIGTDCFDGYPHYEVAADWYDRPRAPATFSATGESVIGFEVRNPGEFVVDFTPNSVGVPIRVGMIDHHTGESGSTWRTPRHVEQYFINPGTLALGRLGNGFYDISIDDGNGGSVGGMAGVARISRSGWTATVRRLDDPKPPPPAVDPPVPTTQPTPDPTPPQNPNPPTSPQPVVVIPAPTAPSSTPLLQATIQPPVPIAATSAPPDSTAGSITPLTATPRPVKLSISGTGRYRTIKVTCQRTRCRVTLKVRVGTRLVRRQLALFRGEKATLTVRHRGRLVTARATVTNLGGIPYTVAK